MLTTWRLLPFSSPPLLLSSFPPFLLSSSPPPPLLPSSPPFLLSSFPPPPLLPSSLFPSSPAPYSPTRSVGLFIHHGQARISDILVLVIHHGFRMFLMSRCWCVGIRAVHLSSSCDTPKCLCGSIVRDFVLRMYICMYIYIYIYIYRPKGAPRQPNCIDRDEPLYRSGAGNTRTFGLTPEDPILLMRHAARATPPPESILWGLSAADVVSEITKCHAVFRGERSLSLVFFKSLASSLQEFCIA